MTVELQMVVYSVILGFVQIVLQAATATSDAGMPWAMGPRDEAKSMSVTAGRLTRALRNFLETFPLFLAAVFVANELNRHNGMTVWGAELYFWARLVYLPLYAFGVTYLRTLSWAVSVVGIALILIGLT
jgi:uncharacterized MAPEG superfamily protein